ncbi:MAG: TlpA family protein disulfide reductase [Myxococcales bacterium]|nr:TlpA family protein disulfide reductase [Myxococcales bacterium]
MNLGKWAGHALLVGLVAITALNFVRVGRNRSSLRPLAMGTAAPPFSLPLLGGGRFELLAAPGRPTVIDFWASWCPPCRAELPTLDRLAARYRGSVAFVAVNVEGAPALPQVEAFAQGAHLTLPIALDGEAVSARYQVDSLPHVVIVDGKGLIRQVLIGPADESEIVAAIDAAR